MAEVILAEDDEAISEPLARALRRDGHEVAVLNTGQGALEVGSAGVGDLMVLDLGLPGIDGIEVIRSLREQGGGSPSSWSRPGPPTSTSWSGWTPAQTTMWRNPSGSMCCWPGSGHWSAGDPRRRSSGSASW